MFVRSSVPARARARRAHYRSAAGLFGILGFHVGVWAVQLAPLSAGLGLDPAVGSAAALRAGMSYRGVYLALAAVMAAGLVAALLTPSPRRPFPQTPHAAAGRRAQAACGSGGSPQCCSPWR